jgi:hypothetical protein
MKPSNAAFLLILIFAFMTAASWLTWANPIVDGGREMNVPLRLTQGELLYSHIHYIYGPAAPYFNAFLYKLFGVHLTTLYTAGLTAALLLTLLIFHLGRQFMSPFEAMLAGTAVILLCVFNQSGNLIFPYSYSALYGTLLGTLALIAQVKHIRSQRPLSLAVAGALAGLALCTKIEFGFAAAVSLLILAITAPDKQRLRSLLIAFGAFIFFPLVISVFSGIRIDSGLRESLFLPGHIPAEIIHFYYTKLGLNNPGRTVRELISSLALLGAVGGTALLAASRPSASYGVSDENRRQLRFIRAVTLGSLAILLLHFLFYGTNWDLHPFRALPVLFGGMILILLKQPAHDPETRETAVLKRQLLVIGVYSLAVLLRVIFRIPAGGGYASVLLPVPIVLFFFLSVKSLPSLAPSRAATIRTQRVVSAVLSVSLLILLGVSLLRYGASLPSYLQTPRGSFRIHQSVTLAMSHSLSFIRENTAEGEPVLAFPEGSSLNFLSNRPNPLRHEILTPGHLSEENELSMIETLERENVRFIFIFNRPTAEFGFTVFGKDYYRTLMGWIDDNYELEDVFGDRVTPDIEIGDPRFFIKCYRRRMEPVFINRQKEPAAFPAATPAPGLPL